MDAETVGQLLLQNQQSSSRRTKTPRSDRAEVDAKPRFTLGIGTLSSRWYRSDNECEPYTLLGTPEYLCPTCRRVDTERFSSEEENEHDMSSVDAIYLGSCQDILLEASTCGLCGLIIEAIRAQVTRSLDVNSDSLERLVADTICSQLYDHYYLYPLIFKTHYWNPMLRISHNKTKIQPRDKSNDDLMIRPFKVNTSRYGRVTTPEHVDYAWLRERLALCDARTTKVTYQHEVLVRVIDVQNMCIKALEPGGRYVALSYVWGAVQQYKLLSDREMQLQQKQSLREVLHELPKTIQDAIELVKRIEEPYLWVDALCIRQDDDRDKAVQIAYMGRIYQGAVLTLAACCGDDANYGLPGAQPGTRSIQQIYRQVGNLTFGIRLPETQTHDFDSVWGTRAWTLQESLLSRRMLRISDDVVSWWCWHSGCYEDENCRHDEVAIGQQIGRDWWIFFNGPKAESVARLKQYSSLDTYACIVSDYTSRTLSFQEDAENALAGILDHLRKHFLGSFVFGLPDVELVNALMWVPLGSSERRTHVDLTPMFPSWSWMGWVGHTAYPWILERQFPSSEIGSPFLLKYTSVDGTGDCWNKVSHYRMSSDRLPRTDHHLWNRSDVDPWCFTHPDLETVHPNPVSTAQDARLFAFLQPGCLRLRFRTLSTQFDLAPSIHRRKDNYDCIHPILIQRIVDKHGLSVGHIYTSGRSSQQDLSMHDVADMPIFHGKHEFVVLSRTSLRSDPTIGADFLGITEHQDLIARLIKLPAHMRFPEEETDRGADNIHGEAHFDRRLYSDTTPWCMYNVLMVARRDEEVSRLAVGRIHIGAFLVGGAEEKEFSLS